MLLSSSFWGKRLGEWMSLLLTSSQLSLYSLSLHRQKPSSTASGFTCSAEQNYLMSCLVVPSARRKPWMQHMLVSRFCSIWSMSLMSLIRSCSTRFIASMLLPIPRGTNRISFLGRFFTLNPTPSYRFLTILLPPSPVYSLCTRIPYCPYSFIAVTTIQSNPPHKWLPHAGKIAQSCKYSHSRCRDQSRMLQQMPEFIGFRSRRGRNPIKKPLTPNSLHCFSTQLRTEPLSLRRLIWLRMTSKGCETVMATIPATKAGMKVECE